MNCSGGMVPEEGLLDPSGLTAFWSICVLLPCSSGTTGLIPCHLSQQHHEAGDGGFILQDPHQ